MRTGRRQPAAFGTIALIAIALSGAGSCLAQFPDPDPKFTPTPAPPQPGASPSPAPSAVAAPPAPAPATPSPDDPRLTAGGALRAFMAARDYRTIRALKGTMTGDLIGRFDRDSTPFCGKRGIRIVAFDFSENDLKAQKPKAATTATAGVGAAGGAAAPAVSGPTAFSGTVRSLWAEQGEAYERRTETVRIVRGADILWRVAALERGTVERLRFAETVDGVTTVRMVLRAWHAGNPEAARPHLAAAFLKKYAGREEALRALFVPAEGGPRHAAYQIVSLTPQGATAADVEVRLYEAIAGQPAPIGGTSRHLRLVKSGARWLVESWT